MQGIDRWKLADELNVYQISLLIAGYDPSHVNGRHSDWHDEIRQATDPFISAIKNAARSGRFLFKQVNYERGDEIDWEDSTVDIETFVEWLKTRNFEDGFFIDRRSVTDAISDTEGPFYAIKLAAAVRAWTEVSGDQAALTGKSPKKALEVWLRKHANEYGLADKDGNPNELGIEEICKVANWKPSGGASPTPSAMRAIANVPRMGRQVPTKPAHPQAARASFGRPRAIDDDIPF